MISHDPEHVFGSERPRTKAPSGTDARDDYDARLDHILEAATIAIARSGYSGASMRTVAKEAGVSLAGLYHYFENKEKMLFLIQFRTFNSLANNLKEKLYGIDEPIDQLRAMIRAHVGYFAANIAALKVCSHEMDSLTGAAYEETKQVRREYYDLTRAVLDRLLDRLPESNCLDRHVVTMSLFGMLNWLYRWYDPKRGPTPNVLAGQIGHMFLTGLLGVEAVGQEGAKRLGGSKGSTRGARGC